MKLEDAHGSRYIFGRAMLELRKVEYGMLFHWEMRMVYVINVNGKLRGFELRKQLWKRENWKYDIGKYKDIIRRAIHDYI